MVRGAVDDLREGGQLVLFPEGTRTVDAPLNPFKPGITLIAQAARRCRSRPSFIETDSPYLGKGWPMLAAAAAAGACSALRLGQRFAPDADHRALAAADSNATSREAMEQRATDAQPDARRRRARHLVLIPSYNTGAAGLRDRARRARAHGRRSGSSSTAAPTAPPSGLQAMAADDPGLRVVRAAAQQRQGRRGAAWPARRRAQAGFTHALTMDSDGQHPADLIPTFMAGIGGAPEAMVLGRPVFDASRAAAARARPAHLQRLDQAGDAAAPASAIRCTAFASIRSRRWSR